MSDKKISQLPASTTPLAGTEELAVVQSGDTKKVSVDDLTDGKLVKMSQLAVGAVTSPTLLAELFSSTAPTLRISNGGGASPAPMISLYRTSGTEAQIYYDPSSKRLDFNNVFAGGAIRFLQGNGVVAQFDSSGNFAPTAGRGISFAADGSAAGMTSELLDDYEEGTWTPTPNNYDGTSVVEGYYTKIGNMCFASFYIALDGTSDGSTFSVLLPFASFNGTNAMFGSAVSYTTSTATGLSFRVRNNNSEFRAYNNSGTELTYNTFGASAVVSGTIIFRTN